MLLQNETPSKCTTKFKPIPYTVKDTKGPMVSAESDSGHPGTSGMDSTMNKASERSSVVP